MKRGFTLVEVLITIAILGILAAMTLPQLLSNQFEDEIVNKLKKAHSTIAQAVESASRTEGLVSDWGSNVNNVYAKISPQLRIIKTFNTSGTGCQNGGAFSDSWRSLTGNTVQNCMLNFSLADGTAVGIKRESNKAVFGVSNQLLSSNFIVFFVDLNGKSDPNVIGADIYAFVLTKKGIVPAGIDNTASCTATGSNVGYNCAAKVLNEEKLAE